MSKSKILFQMTGSIACFKACAVISKLVQAGMDVQVVATRSALQFVGNATLEGLTGRPVVSDLFEQDHVMDHIHLVRWADLILTAPASANFLNKAAMGVGDDLVATQFLAHDFKKPYLVAPAMNTAMYLHPATQKSVKALREMGIEILETASGVLACGEVGWGRLLEPDLIVQEVKRALGAPAAFATGSPAAVQASANIRKILVTAGGTKEPIDQVRAITNTSSGSTGAQIADALVDFGFDVTYLHAENSVLPQSTCNLVSFTTYKDIDKNLRDLLSKNKFFAVVHAAAISDFSVEANSGKISSNEDLTLKLKRNPKLIHQLRDFAANPDLKVIAFKMTATDDTTARLKSVQKILAEAKPNLVVQNDVSELPPRAKGHRTLVYKAGSLDPAVELQQKSELALYLANYLKELPL